MNPEKESTKRICAPENWVDVPVGAKPKAVRWVTKIRANLGKWHYTEGNGRLTACGAVVVAEDEGPEIGEVALVNCARCRAKMNAEVKPVVLRDDSPFREQFARLVADAKISQSRAAQLISEHTQRPCSLRSVQSWMSSRTNLGSRACPEWAVNALATKLIALKLIARP